MLYNKSEVDAGAWLHPRCLDGRWELVRDGWIHEILQVQSAAREAAQALEKANAQLKKEARGERMTWEHKLGAHAAFAAKADSTTPKECY